MERCWTLAKGPEPITVFPEFLTHAWKSWIAAAGTTQPERVELLPDRGFVRIQKEIRSRLLFHLVVDSMASLATAAHAGVGCGVAGRNSGALVYVPALSIARSRPASGESPPEPQAFAGSAIPL